MKEFLIELTENNIPYIQNYLFAKGYKWRNSGQKELMISPRGYLHVEEKTNTITKARFIKNGVPIKTISFDVVDKIKVVPMTISQISEALGYEVELIHECTL